MKNASWILGGLALVVGGVAGWLGGRAREEAGEAAVRATALERRVGDLEGETARLRAEAVREDPAGAALEGRVASLARRLEAMESRGPAAGSAARGGPGIPGEAPEGKGGREGRPSAVDPALRRIYDELWPKVLNDTATAEEQQEFWKALRTEGFADGLLAELESAVEGAPEDIDARMALSRGYIAKLFTVPPGPEMGIWGAKAESQWKEILKRDENHWGARFSLATSYARYPEFLNKTPDAIREFEKVRRVQEALPADPKQAQTYVELALLYTRQNQSDRAREALEAGTRRHPESEAIRKTLESLGR